MLSEVVSVKDTNRIFLPPPRNVQMSQYFEQTAKTPWFHSIVEIMILHWTTSSLTTYMYKYIQLNQHEPKRCSLCKHWKLQHKQNWTFLFSDAWVSVCWDRLNWSAEHAQQKQLFSGSCWTRDAPTHYCSITAGINKSLNHHFAVNPNAKSRLRCFFH